MNYYERHIGDYLKDTAHLSLLEHGVYGRLLDVYYTRESGIPADQVERLIGARSKDERAALATVLDEFFELEGETLTHSRCEREISRLNDKRKKASASAFARWNKAEAHSDGIANAMRTHCEGNARAPVPSHQSPDTRHQTPEEKTARKRAAPLAPPPDVDPQVWSDWLALRKAKRAPVTQTTLDGAASEAAKAGMPLEAFLRVWCRRGSQGLEAEWLKPEERGQRLGSAVTVPSDAAERTAAYLAEQAARGTAHPPEHVRERLKKASADLVAAGLPARLAS